jgi:predicted helicase
LEYYRHKSLKEIFKNSILGSLTKRDQLTVSFDKFILKETIGVLQGASDDASIINQYKINPSDKDGWSLSGARKHLRSDKFNQNCIRKINWRPFDFRWIIYDDVMIARTNRKIMSNFDNQNNLYIISVRQLAKLPFFHSFISDDITDQHLISTQTKEGGVVFPLYFAKKENFCIFSC